MAWKSGGGYYHYYRVTQLGGRGVEVFLRSHFSPRPATHRFAAARERTPTDRFQTRRVYLYVMYTSPTTVSATAYDVYVCYIITLHDDYFDTWTVNTHYISKKYLRFWKYFSMFEFVSINNTFTTEKKIYFLTSLIFYKRSSVSSFYGIKYTS